jgi:hypothetical protein
LAPGLAAGFARLLQPNAQHLASQLEGFLGWHVQFSGVDDYSPAIAARAICEGPGLAVPMPGGESMLTCLTLLLMPCAQGTEAAPSNAARP